MENIKRMNEEFKNILMTLPEGIILINNETNEVTLGNNEFKRLFLVPQQASIDAIGERLKQNVLLTYNKVSNLGQSDYIGSQFENGPSLTVLEAINDTEGYSYQILIDSDNKLDEDEKHSPKVDTSAMPSNRTFT